MTKASTPLLLSEELEARIHGWTMGHLEPAEVLALEAEITEHPHGERIRELFRPLDDLELQRMKTLLPRSSPPGRTWIQAGVIAAGVAVALLLLLPTTTSIIPAELELKVSGVPATRVKPRFPVRLDIETSRSVERVVYFPAHHPEKVGRAHLRGERHEVLARALSLAGDRYGPQEMIVLAGTADCVERWTGSREDLPPTCTASSFVIEVEPPPMLLAVVVEKTNALLGESSPSPTTSATVALEDNLIIIAEPSTAGIGIRGLSELEMVLERWTGSDWIPLGTHRGTGRWEVEATQLFRGTRSCKVDVRLRTRSEPEQVLGRLEMRRRDCRQEERKN